MGVLRRKGVLMVRPGKSKISTKGLRIKANPKCPVHKYPMDKSGKWMPPDGLDPKMKRYACNECGDYWYYSPKWARPKTKEQVQMEFGLELGGPL